MRACRLMQRIGYRFARAISDIQRTPSKPLSVVSSQQRRLRFHDGTANYLANLQPDPSMFTGLIEEVGSVLDSSKGDTCHLRIQARKILEKLEIGDSVAVNGCCLTVARKEGAEITFDLLQETLERTNLRLVQRNSLVNLELALAADGRIGGHFVQGHVDCTAHVAGVESNGADLRLEIELPFEFAHYVAFKGSIAVNGVSLTIAECTDKTFTTWIIPHTQANTNLASVSIGTPVNLEFDLIAKYLERLIERHPVRAE